MIDYKEAKRKVSIIEILVRWGYKYDKSKGAVSPNFVLRDEQGKEIDRVVITHPQEPEKQGYWRRGGTKGDLISFIREHQNQFPVVGRNEVDTVNKVLALLMGQDFPGKPSLPRSNDNHPFDLNAYVDTQGIRAPQPFDLATIERLPGEEHIDQLIVFFATRGITKSALYEIISQDGMPEDCRHVLLCIIGSTKTPDKLIVPDLFGGNEIGEDYTPQAKNLDTQLIDERLRTILLVNIRSFYSNNFNNKNFGIKLCNGTNPVSLFLVGGNSTGKSSIFLAIEKYYTGMVSHARAINSNEMSYMTFGFGQVKDLNVGYLVESESQAEEWKTLQMSKPNDITTSASFCSDYDIERIEKSGENLNEFILEQLGYGDLFLLRQRIDFLLKGLKVNYDISEQELTFTEWAEIIEAFILLHSKTDLNDIKLFQKQSNIEKAVLQGEHHEIFRSHWDMLFKGSAGYINRNNIGIGYGDFFFQIL